MNYVVFYFIQFIIYSFFGWIFECIHMALTTKEVVNRGFLFGPVIPVYGVGLSVIVSLLSKFKSNFIIFLILSFILIAILEYLVSFVLEKIFKMRWWDYSDKKFNLNGRICLNTMIIFIIGATIITYLIHPLIYKFLINIPVSFKNVLFFVLLTLFITDTIFSIWVTRKYVKNNKSNRKDKTPDIRKYTRSYFSK